MRNGLSQGESLLSHPPRQAVHHHSEIIGLHLPATSSNLATAGYGEGDADDATPYPQSAGCALA
jgi:hypothetical protein